MSKARSPRLVDSMTVGMRFWTLGMCMGETTPGDHERESNRSTSSLTDGAGSLPESHTKLSQKERNPIRTFGLRPTTPDSQRQPKGGDQRSRPSAHSCLAVVRGQGHTHSLSRGQGGFAKY